MKWGGRLSGLVATLVIVVVLVIAIAIRQHYTCFGECSHGDRHCQEMCFKKGECPYGWKP